MGPRYWESVKPYERKSRHQLPTAGVKDIFQQTIILNLKASYGKKLKSLALLSER